MFTPLVALFATHLQASVLRADFVVESVAADGSSKEVARSTWSNLLDVNGHSIVSWKYDSNLDKTGWRRDYELDSKGEITFHAYETWFGDLKSRWVLARENGEWTFRGPTSRELPAKKSRFYDESYNWFCRKKVKLGTKIRIAAIDSGTFGVRNGQAAYVRDAEITINKSSVKTHVIQKSWDDELQIWYVTDSGNPVRLEQVFQNSGANYVFQILK